MDSRNVLMIGKILQLGVTLFLIGHRGWWRLVLFPSVVYMIVWSGGSYTKTEIDIGKYKKLFVELIIDHLILLFIARHYGPPGQKGILT